MNEPIGQTAKNNDIEILRGFAIAFTVILHCSLLLPPGNTLSTVLQYFDLSVGVDLFLVISGYVITGSVLQSMHTSHGARRTLLLSFWIKRIFRLLPAAWTWVLIAYLSQIAISWTTEFQYDLKESLIRSAVAFTNLMNFYGHYCIETYGFQSCIRENNLGHYWSLSLEEQFYFVFPILFLFTARRLLVVFLIAAIIAQFMWFRPFFSLAWAFKTDALCWGVLLALFARTSIYRRYRLPKPNHRYVATVIGLVPLLLLPLVAAQIQGVGHDMKPYGVATVAVICASIIWIASFDSHVYSVGGIYSKIMLYLGSRSYSLYLSHLIIFFALRDCFNYFGGGLPAQADDLVFSLVIVGVSLATVLVTSELTYRLIETKFRYKGRLIAARMMSK